MKTMRIFSLFLLLAAGVSLFGLLPFESRDIGGLTVAELLCFTAASEITVTTEDGLSASGATVADAISRLQAAAPGHLLLATVSCVTACGFRPAADELLACGLRPATKLFFAPPGLDPKKAAAYLARHEGGVTLGRLREQPELPLARLVCENGMPYLESAP